MIYNVVFWAFCSVYDGISFAYTHVQDINWRFCATILIRLQVGGVVRRLVFMSSIFLVLSIGCNSPTRPYSELEFSKVEVHYTKAGGWINTVKLDIYGTGLTHAYQISHASLDTLRNISTFLDLEDRRRIAALFADFSSYDSRYEPESWYTDGNHHTIGFLYEGKADTVKIYEPGQANIPRRLSDIIREMDSLWQRVTFPLD